MAQTLLGTSLTPGQRRQVEVIAESGRSLNTLLNDIDTSRDGFDGIITKPIDPRQLQSTLIGAIRRRTETRPPDSSDSANGEGRSGA
jgi:DNA-binding response OmpR family regulator